MPDADHSGLVPCIVLTVVQRNALLGIKTSEFYLVTSSLKMEPRPLIVQKVDNVMREKPWGRGCVIHRINLYPLDSTIGFPNTYAVDSALFGGQRHPQFEQLRPGVQLLERWITASTG